MHAKRIDGILFFSDKVSSPKRIDWHAVAHTALDYFGVFSVVAIPFILGFAFAVKLIWMAN